MTARSNQYAMTSSYEKSEALGPSKFSKSMELISEDSNSTLDVCFFYVQVTLQITAYEYR